MKGKFSPLMIAPPVLFALLALAFYLGMQRPNPDELPSAFLNKPAPPVTDAALPGYDGLGEGGLTEGEVTLVNFWASWCPPCRAEHPTLERLSAEGIRIVGINFGDREADAKRFLAQEGNPFSAIPFDPERPTVTSGIRLGSPAGTTRGFGVAEFQEIGRLIVEVLDGLVASPEDNGMAEARVRQKVQALCAQFPVYQS